MDTLSIRVSDLRAGDTIVEKHPTGSTVTRWPVKEVGSRGRPGELVALLEMPSGALREVAFLKFDSLTVERAS